PLRQPRLRRLERRGRAGENSRVVSFAANYRVRADQHASAALNTDRRIPDRYFAREISLFELCRAGWIGAVVRQRAHRDAISATGEDFSEHIAHELRHALELTVAVHL